MTAPDGVVRRWEDKAGASPHPEWETGSRQTGEGECGPAGGVAGLMRWRERGGGHSTVKCTGLSFKHYSYYRCMLTGNSVVYGG